ncbi:hypothetical protein BN1088_1432296 [Sphingobacterium sp. PM2-P1-29]|nr:hypothetical protein BN1088_1432296 [Sphingobacterium sp. PM2-P1-29]
MLFSVQQGFFMHDMARGIDASIIYFPQLLLTYRAYEHELYFS